VIGPDLEVALHRAFVDARAQRCQTIGIEQLLLALLDEPSAREALDRCGADLFGLGQQLRDHVDRTVAKAARTEEIDTEPTRDFQKAIQTAITSAQSRGTLGRSCEVEGADVLVAMFRGRESEAVRLLRAHGVSRDALVEFIDYRDVEAAREVGPSRVDNEEAIAPRVIVFFHERDAAQVERLCVHLKPLEKAGALALWSNKRMQRQAGWQERLSERLSGAGVVVVLISADFLAVDAVVGNELQPLMAQAQASGTRVMSVVSRPCDHLRGKLWGGFPVLDAGTPLAVMSEVDRDAVFDRVAGEIDSALHQGKEQA
jgi:Clp amino terminal domain, pathogenicity island component